MQPEIDMVAPGAVPLSGPASHRGRRKGGGSGPGLVSILARALSVVSHSGPVILGPGAPPSLPLAQPAMRGSAYRGRRALGRDMSPAPFLTV